MTQENAHTSGEEFISPAEEKKKLKKPVPVGKIICYVMLALYALWLIFPLYTIIATSFTSTEQFTSTLEFVWLPKLTVEPYAKVFSKDVYAMTTGIPSMLLGFINTMWITLVPLIIGLLVSGLSAYAFSKIKFKGRKTLFALSVLTMSFPVGAFTVISYMFYEILGWVGTPLPLIIPGMFGTINMMFFLRMYFDGIPDGLIDSVGVPVVLMSKSAGQYILNNSAENAFTGEALFRSDDPAQTYAAMRSLCRDNGLAEDGLMNIQEARDEARSVLALINLVSFGFIILISIIAMANLFNTVASNIEIRKAEFATLSSSAF